MPTNKGLKAFTLVELVVVITILAILATLSFISYTGNVSNNRDNKRKLDIDTINIALQEYKQLKGVYPLPGDSFNITFSGQVVAKQGLLNKNVILSSLDTIPVDPLDQHYYSYGVTADQKQYQIAATLENDGDETILLKGDYNSVTKRILPNILLATSNTAGINVEIGTGIDDGSTNRNLFLFNNSNSNIIDSLEGGGNEISNGEDLSELLATSESTDYWQKHDYISCDEIFNAGKSIGPGEYQIMNDSGQLVDTYCGMNNPCLASQHLVSGICVQNIQTCSVDNGTGTQTWDSGSNAWIPTTCQATSCDSGYLLAGGVCLSVCTAGGETPCIIQ